MCDCVEVKSDVTELIKVENSREIQSLKISHSITNTNIIIDEKMESTIWFWVQDTKWSFL